MKKIACVGYHATGSGVIDDLLREYDNVAQGQYEVESRVLQDPDGISDLEYYLVENPHRLNSEYAIKRFLQYVDKTNSSYVKIFGKNWKEISKEYAQSLIAFEYPGYWHGDQWLLNPFWNYIHKFRRGIAKVMPKKYRKPAYYNYFPWLTTYHINLSKEEFIAKTQQYINQLCKEVNPEDKEYVVLDQVFPPNNLARYVKYVDSIKTIIVDRDPRDLYIYCMLVKSHVMQKDPHQFCIAYKDNRKDIGSIGSEDCLHMTFEELIFHYEDSVKKVEQFLGIDPKHHVSPMSRFNPQISIKNTKLWEKHTEYSEAVSIIEKELPEYLHKY